MKIIKKLVPSLILSALVLLSCKQKPAQVEIIEKEEIPSHLSLENVHTLKGEELLSSITTEIKYIPLETKKESLLKNVSKVALLKDGNIVITDGDRLYLFAPDGKYIRSVSQKGNGPADYTRISALGANPKTGGFFVQTNAKVMEFDAEGNYLNHFTTENRLMDMVVESTGNILLHRMSVLKSPEDTTTTWMLYRYNDLGEELTRFADGAPRMRVEGVISLMVPTRPLYEYKGESRFNEFGNDTIFIVGEKELIPYTILDLGEMKMPAAPVGGNFDAVYQGLAEKLMPAFLMEDDTYLYMVFGWGFSGKYLYTTYNKTTQQLVNYGEGEFLDTTCGLTNDIDGGLPFYPFIITPQGTRIMWKSAYDFKEAMTEKDYEAGKTKFGEKFENVWNMTKTIQEDDNPVLIIIP